MPPPPQAMPQRPIAVSKSANPRAVMPRATVAPAARGTWRILLPAGWTRSACGRPERTPLAFGSLRALLARASLALGEAIARPRAARAQPSAVAEVAPAGDEVHLDADPVRILEEHRVVARRELRAVFGRVDDPGLRALPRRSDGPRRRPRGCARESRSGGAPRGSGRTRCRASRPAPPAPGCPCGFRCSRRRPRP